MFLSNDLPTKLEITLHSNTLFSSEMLNKINQKISNVDNERVNNNFSISLHFYLEVTKKKEQLALGLLMKQKKLHWLTCLLTKLI